MSIQSKPDYKIFAQDAKSGEIDTFPDILRGWGVTIDRTGEIPPMEWFNAIGKRTDEWLMYLTQRGIPEWDASLDYPKSAVVTHGDVIYISLKATKGESPDTSSAVWSTLSSFLGYGRLLNVQVFTTSASYTPSSGTKSIVVEAVGGGAGGGGSSTPGDNAYSAAGGGSAGTYAKAIFYTLPMQPIDVTIGAGGTGGAASSTSAGAKEGGAGGDTSFGSLLVCPGGSLSRSSDSFPSNSVCSSEYPHASNPAAVISGVIIEEVRGDVGIPGVVLGKYCISGKGGSSPFGTGGVARYRNAGDLASGGDASGYGAGGGGACSSAGTQGVKGGDGSNGCLIVWEYA